MLVMKWFDMGLYSTILVANDSYQQVLQWFNMLIEPLYKFLKTMLSRDIVTCWQAITGLTKQCI